MNVAEQYPARTDSNGTTWYRPQRRTDVSFSQWGWTSDPAQAHPDYFSQPIDTRGCGMGGFQISDMS